MSETEIWLITSIQKEYEIKVIGRPSLIVGITLNWTPIEKSNGTFERYYAKVHLSNPKTVNGLVKLLENKGYSLKERNIPADPSVKLLKSDCPDTDSSTKIEVKATRKLYQMIMGSLIWANTLCR